MSWSGLLVRGCSITEQAGAAITEQPHTEGYEAGYERGFQAGRRAVRVSTLEGLLKSKFGSLSPETMARIEQASNDELLRGIQRTLTATTVEAVFEA